MGLRQTAVLLFLLFLVARLAEAHGSDEWEEFVIRSPWALGLTIPDKSPLEDGEVLDWSAANNLTIVVTLPNINYTDNTLYVIVSVMTMSGTVLQVAAGLEPGQEVWSTHVMYVTGVYGSGKEYHLVARGAAPYSRPGDKLSISIYSAMIGPNSTWFGEVYNYLTGEGKRFVILVNGSSSFRAGSQEVIALESYTSKEEVFTGMGRMILHGIFINGRRVVGGWYVDDGQVFYRESLFVVGGGAPVPSFISIDDLPDHEVAWLYSPAVWETSDLGGFYTLLLLMALALLIIVVFAVRVR
ncbi:MAG: hypothetical protein QXQ48_06375 [Nitrososphaerota archaeon]